MTEKKKLWGGRFSKDIDEGVAEWASSIAFDQILYRDDISGSIAHAKMLAEQGIISAEDAARMEAGLREILAEIGAGEIAFTADNEDIHMNIEALLTDRIGEAGGRLHTARSRNDQVATDIRLWLREEILSVTNLIHEVRSLLVGLAKEHTQTLMPGYTHLQHAQPVSFAFHMLAWYQMFSRDAERMWDVYKRTDILPLGAGALSGVSYDTDRGLLADLLDFSAVAENAMDAVSDRDFVIEYISAAAICMMHLSRACEELILWSSAEFGFVEMDDAYSTGSSIMPQKKNPDMAELIRGKTGRVYGDLMSILTTMKGLPLAYNKDMQEDKEPLFDASGTLRGCLSAFLGMTGSMKINKDAMAQSAGKGFMNATDAADYLVRKGIPFRRAHEIVGKLVAYCAEKGIVLEAAEPALLQQIAPEFGGDFFDAISLLACMNAKYSEGSTSEARVSEQIQKAEKALG
ncbi:MAG: argininosuccinate lyase [Clostridiales Family XIII bacterium]|jgi:argininosuccinate lyase|nr:argininosuccinate lyase [Clostridiales Family XIII bacterium]